MAACVCLFTLTEGNDAARIECMRCGALVYLNEIFMLYEDDQKEYDDDPDRVYTYEETQLYEAARALMSQLTAGGKRAEQYRRGYYKAISASPSKRRGGSRSQSATLSPKQGGNVDSLSPKRGGKQQAWPGSPGSPGKSLSPKRPSSGLSRRRS